MEYNYIQKKEMLSEDMKLELVIFTIVTMILDGKISIESFKLWFQKSIKGDEDEGDDSDDDYDDYDQVIFLKNSFPSHDIVINYILDCIQINLKHILENKDSNEYFESTYKSIRLYNNSKEKDIITSPTSKSLQPNNNQGKTKTSKTKKSIPINIVFSTQQGSSYKKRSPHSQKPFRKPIHNNNNNNNNNNSQLLGHKINHNKQSNINIEEDFPILKKSPTPNKKLNLNSEFTKNDIEKSLSNRNRIDIMIKIYKIILELFPLRTDDINIFFKILSCNIFSTEAISDTNNDHNITKIYEIKSQLDAIYFSCNILSLLLPLLKFMNQIDIEYLKNHSAFPVLFPDICKSLYDQLSSHKQNIFLKSSNYNNKLLYTNSINGLIKVKGKNGSIENRREKILLNIQKSPHSLSSVIKDLKYEDYEWFSSLLINLLLSTNNTIHHLDLTVEKRHSLNQRFGIHQADHTSTNFDPKSYQSYLNDDFRILFDSEEIHFYDLFKHFKEWRFIYHVKNKIYIMMMKLIIEPFDNIRNFADHVHKLMRIAKFLALLNVFPFISFKSKSDEFIFDDNNHIEVIEMIQLSKEYGSMTLHIPWIVQYIRILSRCKVIKQSKYFKSIIYHINEMLKHQMFNLYNHSFNINRFFIYHCLQSLLMEHHDIIIILNNENPSSYIINNQNHPLFINQIIKENLKQQSKSNIDQKSELIDDIFISTLFKYFDTLKMILRDLKPNDSSKYHGFSKSSNQPMKKLSPIQIGSSFDLDKEIQKWLSFNNDLKRMCVLIQRSVTNITIETFSNDIKNSIQSSLTPNSNSSTEFSESIIQQWEEQLSSFFEGKIKESLDILSPPHISENAKNLLKIFTIQSTKQSIEMYIKDIVIRNISK